MEGLTIWTREGGGKRYRLSQRIYVILDTKVFLEILATGQTWMII